MPDSLTDLGGWKVGAEDFLAAVLQTTAQPIWVVDPGGEIRFANAAAVATLGYDSANELLGRNSHETIHHHHPDGSPYPAAECPILLPRVTGETVSSELDWFFRRDGSMFPVSYVSVPIEMQQGRGAVLAFNDIADRQRADEVIREHDATLGAQQEALRRVATLIAGGASSADVFAAVAREVGTVLGIPVVAIMRVEPGERMTVAESWSREGPAWFPPDDEGPFDSAPIMVDGRLWGVMATASVGPEPLPEGIGERLTEFTELIGTAISTTQARDDLRSLADEQAALRRVATLVAQGTPPTEVFAAVAQEVAALLELPLVEMCRFDPGATATVIGAAGEHPFQPGTSWPLEGATLAAQVWRTGATARVNDYADVSGPVGRAALDAGVHAGVGAPIIVDGELWGIIAAGGDVQVPIAADAELRLSAFTELVATAISNSQARGDLQRLAEEQAALRRVAVLVARGAEPSAVFDAVCEETGRLLGAASVNLAQLTADDQSLAVAGWSLRDVHVPAGTSLPLEGEIIDVLVKRTAAPSRVDSYEGVDGELAALLRHRGIRSEVGAPVMVGGEVWGALIAGTDEAEPLPEGTELRLAGFAELIGTAVSNAATRSELIASRARIVTAGDAARRRLARDLHDGAQQRLVTALMSLQMADQQMAADPETGARLLEQALGHMSAGLSELRELAAGVHPTILTNRGLRAAIEALADRSPVPVEVDVTGDRFATHVEAGAYFLAAEALTNVAKHAGAGRATVTIAQRGHVLAIEIADDGAGGANLDGHGLRGMDDRVQALGGTLHLDSPPAAGTRIQATLPLST